MNLLLKKSANRQCWLLPVLAVMWLCPWLCHAQGIIHVQLPPSPSLSEAYDTNGNLIDPNAPYDAQGLRLAGSRNYPASWDLVINGQTILIFSSDTSFSVTAIGSNAVVGAWVGSFLPTFYVAPLTDGDMIDGSAAGYQWNSSGLLAASIGSGEMGNPILTIGAFAYLPSGYVGFEFYQDGDPYYGWVRVGAPSSLNWGWVYEYAYETMPNTPIMAGQIPEPGTWALLGLGGLTFFILRRKWQFP